VVASLGYSATAYETAKERGMKGDLEEIGDRLHCISKK